VGQGLLIHEVSRSHATTHHSRKDSSGRVISSSQRPLPDNTQHSLQTNIQARWWDSNPQSQQASGRRPRGHWDRLLKLVVLLKSVKVEYKIILIICWSKWCVQTATFQRFFKWSKLLQQIAGVLNEYATTLCYSLVVQWTCACCNGTDDAWHQIYKYEVITTKSVRIATLYGLDGPGIESRWGLDFPQPSRPALVLTQPLT